MMETKYYIDTAGKYIGGFSGSTPPMGSIEVSSPPAKANSKWNGTEWREITSLPKELLDRANVFKSDMQILQMRWLAAAVADGVEELNKKALVEQDIADLKVQYSADIAAIKLKYN